MTDEDEVIARYLETGDESLLGDVDAATAGDARSMRAMLSEPSTWDEPSADLPDRIAAEIQSAPRAGGGVTSIDAARRRRAVSPVATAVIGLAAGLVIALGVVAVLSRSDGPDASVELVATRLSPQATGTAELLETSSGFELRLDIDSLPRAPAGSYYQAWLRGDRGLVAIGTFHTGGEIVLWSGVAPAAYPELTITLEPEDGDPASSGQQLLRATLPDR